MKVRFLARAGRQVRFLLILHLISFLFFSEDFIMLAFGLLAGSVPMPTR
jgi:hypothetical protein